MDSEALEKPKNVLDKFVFKLGTAEGGASLEQFSVTLQALSQIIQVLDDIFDNAKMRKFMEDSHRAALDIQEYVAKKVTSDFGDRRNEYVYTGYWAETFQSKLKKHNDAFIMDVLDHIKVDQARLMAELESLGLKVTEQEIIDNEQALRRLLYITGKNRPKPIDDNEIADIPF